MVTIATLNSLNDAHLLRSILESSEIPAFIPDENTAQADWTLINAMGGIRIQVPEDFVEEAKKVLADYNSNLGIYIPTHPAIRAKKADGEK